MYELVLVICTVFYNMLNCLSFKDFHCCLEFYKLFLGICFKCYDSEMLCLCFSNGVIIKLTKETLSDFL